MANFFEGLWNIAKHPIDEAKWMWDETKNVGKPLLKGDLSEAFDEFKGTFGRHNEMMSENIAKPLGGDNWITQNPDAVAGAIVGGILAAPAIGGAMGGGAGGAGGTTGVGWQGGAQLGFGGSSYAPSTAFGQSSASLGGSSGGTGAMGLPTAYTPTTAFGQGAAYGSTGTGGTSMQQIGKGLQQAGGQRKTEDDYASEISAPRTQYNQIRQSSDINKLYSDLISKYPEFLMGR